MNADVPITLKAYRAGLAHARELGRIAKNGGAFLWDNPEISRDRAKAWAKGWKDSHGPNPRSILDDMKPLTHKQLIAKITRHEIAILGTRVPYPRE